MKSPPHFDYEKKYWSQGYTVLGIDEVGKGCLAGPITVGCIEFSPLITAKSQYKLISAGVRDSKQLTAKKRQNLITLIQEFSTFMATESSDVAVINTKGIEYALKIAIANIVLRYKKEHPENKILLLVDGRGIAHIPYINDIERFHLIGGDGISVSIGAASIVAKVTRDQYMDNLSGHELYGWQSNKGYGTKKHCEAIAKHGLTIHHRSLFVRNILSKLSPK